MPALAVGQVAPPFELTSTEGKTYALKNALGQEPLLAVFFKVSCPTCQYTLPFVERLYQQLRSQGAPIWGIVQDNTRDGQRFAKEYGVTFPILVDDEPFETSQEYGLQFVPAFFLIAPDGQVELSGDGFSKADLLEIQARFAKYLGTTLAPLFLPGEKIPEYKPG